MIAAYAVLVTRDTFKQHAGSGLTLKELTYLTTRIFQWIDQRIKPTRWMVNNNGLSLTVTKRQINKKPQSGFVRYPFLLLFTSRELGEPIVVSRQSEPDFIFIVGDRCILITVCSLLRSLVVFVGGDLINLAIIVIVRSVLEGSSLLLLSVMCASY